MSSISFTAHGRCARATVCEPITTGSVGLSVSFAFDAAWSGLQKTAIFRGSGMAVDLVLSGDAATVPPEVLTIPGGDLRVGVWGADPDGNVIIPTVWVTVGEIVPGSAPSGFDPDPPTPSWAAQVQEIAQDALDTANSVREDADAGAFDGATYTPAVSAGGDLSWTNDKGKPNPPTVNIKGPEGQPGQTGATPDISIGTVETLPPGSPATATITGTAENPVLSFGIPQGQQGDPGEVTQSEFDELADEVSQQKSAIEQIEPVVEDTYRVHEWVEIQGVENGLYRLSKQSEPYTIVSESSTSYSRIIVPVESVYSYRVSSYVNDDNRHCMVIFANDNDDVVGVQGQNRSGTIVQYTNELVVVPDGATKMYICGLTTGARTLKVEKGLKVFVYDYAEATQAEVDALASNIGTLETGIADNKAKIQEIELSPVAFYTDEGAVLPFEPVVPSKVYPVSKISSTNAVNSIEMTICKKNLFDDSFMSMYSTETPHEFYAKCIDFQNLPFFMFKFPGAKHFVLSYSAKGASASTTASINMRIYYTDGDNRNLNISNEELKTQEYVRKSIDLGLNAYQNKTIDYIRFIYNAGRDEYIYIKDIQLEMGHELTYFEPFDGTKYVQELSAGITNGEFDWTSGILKNTSVTPATYTQLTKHDIDAISGKLFARTLYGTTQVTYGLSLNANGKLAGRKCYCFGDSITANYEFPFDYPTILMKCTGMDVKNVAFGGCKMSYHAGVNGNYSRFSMYSLADSMVSGSYEDKRTAAAAIYANNRSNLAYIDSYSGDYEQYAYDRIDILDAADWSKVDYITIAYGTNDWNSATIIDNPENPLDTTTYCGAARYAIEKILTAYPNIKILLMAPIWRWFVGAEYSDSDTAVNDNGKTLFEFGEALANVAKEYHLPILDMYWNLGIGKINRLEYFRATDGTHPKYNGIALIGERLSEKMLDW